jgi:hypothetical protein
MQLWDIWVLGAAATVVAACGTRVSLGDISDADCSPPNACASSADASADDSSALIDAGTAYDADAQAASGQPIDSGQAADTSAAADSSLGSDSGQPDSTPSGSDGAVPDGGPLGNTVSGSPDGTRPFGAVSNSWWIQTPDPRVAGGPVVSTVVYLFSKPVPCSKLNVPKWDETNELGDTQNIEIEMAWTGTTEPTAPPPIAYSATLLTHAAVPAPGMAGVFYQVTPPQPPGPPSELGAVSGTVTLTALNATTNVTGTFDLVFAGGHAVTASFDAPYCPNGREP